MYGALWRVLPGPAWLRILILAVGVAAVLTSLALWVFPWIQQLLPAADVTVEGQ